MITINPTSQDVITIQLSDSDQIQLNTAAIVIAGGDVETLGGQDGAYYLSRGNHTGTQAISTVTGLQAELNGRSLVGHTHTQQQVTGLPTRLSDIEASVEQVEASVEAESQARILFEGRRDNPHQVTSAQTGYLAPFTGAQARTQSDKNADTVNVSDFLTGAQRADADLPTPTLNYTAAINAAAAAAASRGADLVFSKTYPCAGVVTIPDNVVVRGVGRRRSGIIGSATTTVVCGSGVSFYDIKIFNSSALHICVSSPNADGAVFDNCLLNGRVNCINSTAFEKRAPRFFNTMFSVDFGADYNGIDQMDVFGIYGCYAPIWSNCVIDVANVHRIFKLSEGLFAPLGTQPSANNTRAVIIDNCTIRGYGGKQILDAYFGTSAIFFTNNRLELPDTATISGAKFTVCLENKTEADQRDIADTGAGIIVSGNTGYMACNFIAMQGNWSITQAGYSGSRTNNIKIVNNDLRRVAGSAEEFVSVRFFSHVYSNGNTFAVPVAANARVVSMLSNESVYIGGGDEYDGGCLLLSSTTTNAGAQTFTGLADDITVDGLRVSNFDGTAAITGTSINAKTLTITGLKSRPVASPTQLCRAVSSTPTTRLDRLILRDIDATHPTGSVLPVFDAVATAAIYDIKDCSWLPRFRGYSGTVPTTGTYLRGDTVRHPTPSIGSVAEWTCLLGGTPGTWRATSFVANRGTTATRPASLTANDVGALYFDTTLAAAGKPIFWTGTAWVDGIGATV